MLSSNALSDSSKFFTPQSSPPPSSVFLLSQIFKRILASPLLPFLSNIGSPVAYVLSYMQTEPPPPLKFALPLGLPLKNVLRLLFFPRPLCGMPPDEFFPSVPVQIHQISFSPPLRAPTQARLFPFQTVYESSWSPILASELHPIFILNQLFSSPFSVSLVLFSLRPTVPLSPPPPPRRELVFCPHTKKKHLFVLLFPPPHSYLPPPRPHKGI